jgi:hypothetical protein
VLEVIQRIKIARPVDVVRSQFADVAYHAGMGVHRGVSFLIENESAGECAYEQVTRVGPLRLRQRFLLDRTDPATQVNAVVAGVFAGGALTFSIDAEGDETVVVATLCGAPNVIQRLLGPLLRRQLARSLARALAEDRLDLESGRYEARLAA